MNSFFIEHLWWLLLEVVISCVLCTAWKVSVFGVFQVRIQSECGKIWTRKTPNPGNLHPSLEEVAVEVSETHVYSLMLHFSISNRIFNNKIFSNTPICNNQEILPRMINKSSYKMTLILLLEGAGLQNYKLLHLISRKPNSY